MKKTTVYAAIVETEGRTWIDTSTISVLRERTKETNDDFRKKFPQWSKANKFINIGKFELIPTE